MAIQKNKASQKPKRRVEVEVPIEENDIKVVDIKLGELVALIAICSTLAAVGFTYYTYVKSKAEAKKMESIAGVISAGIKGLSDIMPRDVVNEIPKAVTTVARVAAKKTKRGARA